MQLHNFLFAITPGAQLGPGDLRMDAGAWAAVGAGDDVFSADDFGERDETIGSQGLGVARGPAQGIESAIKDCTNDVAWSLTTPF